MAKIDELIYARDDGRRSRKRQNLFRYDRGGVAALFRAYPKTPWPKQVGPRSHFRP